MDTLIQNAMQEFLWNWKIIQSRANGENNTN
jgi:hypothetical protein